MNTMQLKAIFTDLSKAARKHSPEILTGIGIAGMLSTTVFAVRATPKALMLIEEKKREKKFAGEQPELRKVEVIKAAWKPYISAAVTGVASVVCLVGASSVNARRNAALAAAYALSETTLADYKEKVVETLGEKKAQEVKDAIAKDKIDNDPVSRKEVVITDKGETLFYESLSGRYFKSDYESIRSAVNTLNEQLLLDEYISLNEFYEAIGLDGIEPLGEQLKWRVRPDSSDKGLIQLDFSSQLTDDMTPCAVIGFSNPPKYDLRY